MITNQQAMKIKQLASELAIAEGKYSQAKTRGEQDIALVELRQVSKEFDSYIDSLKG